MGSSKSTIIPKVRSSEFITNILVPLLFSRSISNMAKARTSFTTLVKVLLEHPPRAYPEEEEEEEEEE